MAPQTTTTATARIRPLSGLGLVIAGIFVTDAGAGSPAAHPPDGPT